MDSWRCGAGRAALRRGAGKLAFAVAAMLVAVGNAGAVTIDWVTVGSPGNANDNTGLGAVNYSYDIGKYEVTAAQYTEFLNAVAAEDTYGVYKTDQANVGITRSGTPGAYSYTVDPNWANRPALYLSWGSAARFANWIANGQLVGPQDASTTEDGSYTLAGATTTAELNAVVRNPNATIALPSENEWYKAAYYDPAIGGYWNYPTRSDTLPSNVLSDPAPDPGNNANYHNGTSSPSAFTIGPPYNVTEVGSFENSESGWGTFDQGGNAFEWSERVVDNTRRVKGGAYNFYAVAMSVSGAPTNFNPAGESYVIGFRLVNVTPLPEPSAIALAAVGLVGLVGWARWRRS
jgi:sulfatase modifying factor 1